VADARPVRARLTFARHETLPTSVIWKMLSDQFQSFSRDRSSRKLFRRPCFLVCPTEPSNCGTTASEGNRASLSISSGVFYGVVHIFAHQGQADTANQANEKASTTLRVFAGRAGVKVSSPHRRREYWKSGDPGKSQFPSTLSSILRIESCWHLPRV